MFEKYSANTSSNSMLTIAGKCIFTPEIIYGSMDAMIGLVQGGRLMNSALMVLAERGLAVSIEDYINALDSVQQIRSRLAMYFETADFLLMPTSASLPWALGAPCPSQINGGDVGPRAAAIFATFVNAAALPAISIPIAPSCNGLPIGMQLVGPFGADLAVFRLAKLFEKAAPWIGRSQYTVLSAEIPATPSRR